MKIIRYMAVMVMMMSGFATAALAAPQAQTAAQGQYTESVEVAAAEADSTAMTAQTQAADSTAAAAIYPATASAEDLWQAGNAAYTAGDYARAAEIYTAIVDKGLYSATLYYNLANALFKSGQTGGAILYYNRALRLSPGDEDIRHNLEYAERTTKDKIEEIPEFFLVSWAKKLRSTMSCTAWTVISLVLLAATLALGLVYLLSQRISMRKSGFYGMAAALVLFIATTLMAWSERNMLVDRNEAVVMSSALSVKSSPDKSATDLFVLHEGTVVTISSTVEGWAEVRIADGNKGWVETDRIERI